MIKAIIFDLDNTLIDFMKMKELSIDAAASSMIDAGLPRKKSAIVKKLFQLYEKYGYEDQTVFQRYLKESGHFSYRILASGITSYRRVRTGFLDPYPHVVSTLVQLNSMGIKLAIVSDAPKLKAWIRLTAMRIDSFFEIVVGFEDTKVLKPSREPFVVALKELKVKADECLMVGDMPKRDILGAKNLGMKTCFAKYGNLEAKNVKADYVISDVSEILKIVKK